MDRIRLIELIEGQTARLSAEGRGLWEELEFLRESIPDPEEQDRMAREYDIMERIFDLPVAEQFLTSRLAELVAALRRAEEAERRGKPGDDHRARGVINAAMLKDSEEGQQTDPHMTLGRAIARLEARLASIHPSAWKKRSSRKFICSVLVIEGIGILLMKNPARLRPSVRHLATQLDRHSWCCIV